MPDKVVSQLESIIASQIAEEDIFPIVDVSESDLSLKNKKITVAELGKIFGEPYVDINSTGTIPNVEGTDGIGIGSEVTIAADSTNSIAIGKGTNINFATDAIGLNAEVNFQTTLPGAGGIAIGTDSLAQDFDSIALGKGALASNEYSVVIGSNAKDTNGPGLQPRNVIVLGKDSAVYSGSDFSIAIGDSAVINNASNAIQLGTGTNTTSQTLQFRSLALANNNSLLTQFVEPNNYSPTALNEIDSHLIAIDTALENAGGGGGGGTGDGEPYVEVNSTGTLPLVQSTAENSIAIGRAAGVGVDSHRGVAIGNFAYIEDNCINSVVTGSSSTIAKDSDDAIVIGSNSKAGYYDYYDPTYTTVAPKSIIVGSNSYTSDSNTVSIGYNNAMGENCSQSISLGFEAKVLNGEVLNDAKNNIAIGTSALCETTNNTIAIGLNAQGKASNAIQLGTGVNTTPDTIQFQDITIANKEGLQAPTSTGIPLTIPNNGSFFIDDTLGSERICCMVNGTWMCANLVAA